MFKSNNDLLFSFSFKFIIRLYGTSIWENNLSFANIYFKLEYFKLGPIYTPANGEDIGSSKMFIFIWAVVAPPMDQNTADVS